MKKNQPRQRPNQQLPQKQRKKERVAAEDRAAREAERQAVRDKAAKKKETKVSPEMGGTYPGLAMQAQHPGKPPVQKPPTQQGVTATGDGPDTMAGNENLTLKHTGDVGGNSTGGGVGT